MTNLTPDLEAMVEPMARELNRIDNFAHPEVAADWEELTPELQAGFRAEARFAISLGARIEVPKSPGQRAFEKYCEVWCSIGLWENYPLMLRESWEQIAAAAREES